jgi:predicted regulator of Ras-like GTPase activity (Roadblock/LC7/MglB family)
MDAASALADLLEISSQVDAAVLLAGDGSVAASTLATEGATERLARAGTGVLEAAEARFAGNGRAPTQVEAALREGSVFVVRQDGRTIVARSQPKPLSQLVLHDLGACLQAAAPAKPKRRAPRKKVEADA